MANVSRNPRQDTILSTAITVTLRLATHYQRTLALRTPQLNGPLILSPRTIPGSIETLVPETDGREVDKLAKGQVDQATCFFQAISNIMRNIRASPSSPRNGSPDPSLPGTPRASRRDSSDSQASGCSKASPLGSDNDSEYETADSESESDNFRFPECKGCSRHVDWTVIDKLKRQKKVRFGIELEFMVVLREREDFLTLLTDSKYYSTSWLKEPKPKYEYPDYHFEKRNLIRGRDRLLNYLKYNDIQVIAGEDMYEDCPEEKTHWQISRDGTIMQRYADAIRLRLDKNFTDSHLQRYDVKNLTDAFLPIHTEGVELISPVMTWKKDWKTKVKPLLDTFMSPQIERSLFPVINDTTGLHVHTEIFYNKQNDDYHSDCENASVGAIYRTYVCRNLAWIIYCFEPILDLLHYDVRIPHPDSIKNTTLDTICYFQSSRAMIEHKNSLQGRDAHEVFSELHTHLDIVELMNPALDTEDYCSGRFYKYNFHAREHHGTVEFRQMGMQFEEQDVKGWTQTCVRLMEIAREVKWETLKYLEDVKVEDGIESLVKFLETDKAHEWWLRKRAKRIKAGEVAAKYATYYLKDFRRGTRPCS